MGKGIRRPAASHESERIGLGELIHQHVRLAIDRRLAEDCGGAQPSHGGSGLTRLNEIFRARAEVVRGGGAGSG